MMGTVLVMLLTNCSCALHSCHVRRLWLLVCAGSPGRIRKIEHQRAVVRPCHRCAVLDISQIPHSGTCSVFFLFFFCPLLLRARKNAPRPQEVRAATQTSAAYLSRGAYTVAHSRANTSGTNARRLYCRAFARQYQRHKRAAPTPSLKPRRG